MLNTNSSSYLKRSAVQFCKDYKLPYHGKGNRINIKPAPFTHFYFHFDGTRCKKFNCLEFNASFEFEANTFVLVIHKMIDHKLIDIKGKAIKRLFKHAPFALLI